MDAHQQSENLVTQSSKGEHHLPNGQGFTNPWPSLRNVTNTDFARAWVRQVMIELQQENNWLMFD
jgi:hypothetical protein